MKDRSLTVNGRPARLRAAAKTPLLFLLRNDLGYKGVRLGCGTGHCGACTVLVNGRAVQSCATPWWSVPEAAAITTIEGLACEHGPDRLIKAFVDAQAAQCAYCIPGIIVGVRGYLNAHPDAAIANVTTMLSERHLCRCGAHVRILRAIAQVLDEGMAL